VLAEIDAAAMPRELVLNKVDAVDPLARRRLANRFPGALQVSAKTGEGVDALRARVAERLGDRFQPVRLVVPYSDGRVLTELYATGAPIEERADRPDGVHVLARLPRGEVGRFGAYLVVEHEAPAEADTAAEHGR
jgi:GTP-binding protein HflX